MVSGIYIHVPFCVRKCPYCGFYSVPYSPDLAGRYIRALESEFDVYQRIDFSELKTIYIGGGTPTALPLDQLDQLLSVIYKNVNRSDLIEFTMEANPGTLDRDKLALMFNQGVNRISLGAQSFNHDLLQYLGRIHTPQDITKSIIMIRQSGFSNLNLDLMFAIPGQTAAIWKEDLARAVEFKPEHLSLYGLTLEKGTPFYTAHEKREMVLPDEQEYARCFESARHFLRDNDIRDYEISNFSRSECECRHNLNYWHYKDYLGLGPAAHSFIKKQRWWNVSDVRAYIDKCYHFLEPVERWETLTEEQQRSEFIFLALRTIGGVTYYSYWERFKRGFKEDYKRTLDSLEELGLIYKMVDRFMLTDKGLLVSDSVFAEFM